MNEREKILDGITVPDRATFVTGGFCSAMLANQGAEVITSEQPGYGDAIRHSGPPFINDELPDYWMINCGRRNPELDPKNPEAKEVLHELAETAAVFRQNFRPGIAERLDIDFDSIIEYGEDFIYLAISAFGQTRPWREYNRETLQEWGYSDDNLDGMMESGAFGEQGSFAEWRR